MKVIDLIKVCRGNVRFRFDTEEPLIDRQNALKVCWDKGILEREVATVTFDVDGYGDVICEISTIYEDNVQA